MKSLKNDTEKLKEEFWNKIRPKTEMELIFERLNKKLDDLVEMVKKDQKEFLKHVKESS